MKTKLLFVLTYFMSLLAIAQTENRDRPFSWDNGTVYFVIQDRFENGNTANDQSYGRGKDGNGVDYGFGAIGDFHGGDFVGLTNKINAGYFDDLGVNAIWFSSPYEQIHGWVSGGSDGDFRHYAYHGYYGLDWTEMDANFGTEAEFRAFVDAAHDHGIRLVMDIVMNHVGYNTLHDMDEYNFGCPDSNWKGWRPSGGQNWASIHDLFIDYTAGCNTWGNWWSGDWVRAGLPGYPAPGGGDKTMALSGLPDVITEATTEVGIAPILLTKWSPSKLAQEQAELDAFFARTGYPKTVRSHYVKWLTDWVREYGIDGFRVDTEKHVEGAAWKVLKDEALIALQEWKTNNPTKKLDDLPFWMVGENFNYGYGRSQYNVDSGFDGLINFSFQDQAGNLGNLENIYSSYAAELNNNADWNALSYISSHDTKLFDRGNLIAAGTSLLLAPGAVQIYYGDETARPFGATGSDPMQGTRSYMNWGSINTSVQSHWQAVGQFRRNHLAVGGGTHQQLTSSPYTFFRELGNDRVVVVIGASSNTTIDVSAVYSNGTELRDAYTGTIASVSNGSVTFGAHANGVILIEETNPIIRPSVVVNPASGYDPNSITMTASATDDNDPNPSIYYTTNLSLGTSDLNTWTAYNSGVAFTETTDVQVVAKNASGALSSVVTRKYAIGAIDGFKVYYKTTCGTTPNIYYWAEDPSVLTDVAWPGVAMTSVGGGWYEYDLPGILSTSVIFNDCNGQTGDLTRDRLGWYDGGWSDIDPRVNQAPVLTVDPVGGQYDTGVTVIVALSATDDTDVPSIYYTLDGSVPSQSSTLYTGSISVTSDVTIRAIAYDSELLASNAVSETYTFVIPPTAMTVYYKGNFATPTIYFWATSPGTQATAWPGVAMTDDGNGWYSFTFDQATSANIIFSDNGANQTADLSRTNTGWYENGVWYDNITDPVLDLTIHFKKPSGWSTANMHYWNATPSGVASTNWPGVAMTNDGNGWYSYTITGASCADIVFNDNGGTQTADLSRCGEGWYDNSWSDTGVRQTVLTTSILQESEYAFNVYPNPSTKGWATIDFDLTEAQQVSVKIYDLSGVQVGELISGRLLQGNHSIQLNTSEFSTGIYLLRMTTEDQAIRRRLIIQN